MSEFIYNKLNNSQERGTQLVAQWQTYL
jgi:hypothetical protein